MIKCEKCGFKLKDFSKPKICIKCGSIMKPFIEKKDKKEKVLTKLED